VTEQRLRGATAKRLALPEEADGARQHPSRDPRNAKSPGSLTATIMRRARAHGRTLPARTPTSHPRIRRRAEGATATKGELRESREYRGSPSTSSPRNLPIAIAKERVVPENHAKAIAEARAAQEAIRAFGIPAHHRAPATSQAGSRRIGLHRPSRGTSESRPEHANSRRKRREPIEGWPRQGNSTKLVPKPRRIRDEGRCAPSSQARIPSSNSGWTLSARKRLPISRTNRLGVASLALPLRSVKEFHFPKGGPFL
jgi:hypothetical protein